MEEIKKKIEMELKEVEDDLENGLHWHEEECILCGKIDAFELVLEWINEERE
ncbi:hypothetical protein [Rossellomorea marisflavi]|uniref:hypothetical protein n=1 Tax=Rossellomorea marisflavi TaxID=189381 RepID=UPI0016538073|nr:hypothetical protein [Rossellomorea marisflavi]